MAYSLVVLRYAIFTGGPSIRHIHWWFIDIRCTVVVLRCCRYTDAPSIFHRHWWSFDIAYTLMVLRYCMYRMYTGGPSILHCYLWSTTYMWSANWFLGVKVMKTTARHSVISKCSEQFQSQISGQSLAVLVTLWKPPQYTLLTTLEVTLVISMSFRDCIYRTDFLVSG